MTTPAVDATLPYVVGRLDWAVRRQIEASIARFEMTLTPMTVMSVLRRQPGLSNAQLARRAHVSPQSMNETLLDLERRKLVRRAPHPTKGRIRQTTLTRSGEALIAKCEAAVAEVEREMLADMTPAARELFRLLLVQAVRNLGGGLGGEPARDAAEAEVGSGTRSGISR